LCENPTELFVDLERKREEWENENNPTQKKLEIKDSYSEKGFKDELL